MLRLPILPNINQTLASWGRELRSSGVVAVGRSPKGLPQFNATSGDFESVELADCGSGWQEFDPLIKDGSVPGITSPDVTLARWTQIGRTIFGKLNFNFVTPGGTSGDVAVVMPLKIKTFLDIVRIGEGIADGAGLIRKKATLFTDVANTQTDPVMCTVYTGDAWPASTQLRVYLDFTAEAYYG